MDHFENIRLAFRSIRTNLLRAALTILIIAFGIMALVGILTSIDGIKSSISENFSEMGANTFNIRNAGTAIRMGRRGARPKPHRQITHREAVEFSKRYRFPAVVSVSTRASGAVTVRYGSRKTNPNVQVLGGDEHYLNTAGMSLGEGRNFSINELRRGSDAAIIGQEVAGRVFGEDGIALHKRVMIGHRPYMVIGLLEKKGSSSIFNPDNLVIIPLNNARNNFARADRTYAVSVAVKDIRHLDYAVSEATGVFRAIRGLRAGEENDFEVAKSDNLAAIVIDNLRYVTMASTLIGFITLLGAAIGLMNILLVAVTERTREIGLCKALGATPRAVQIQFLTESLVICQAGGVLGILLGIAAGNMVSAAVGGSFIIPWLWISSGIMLCMITGVAAGFYPAVKAGRLNPIEALRHE